MKKICLITTVSITMKSFVLETAKYLHNECGYDITLVCDNDNDFAASLPEYLHYIPVEMARGIDLSALKSIRAFRKIFKKEKFDMVQYSTPNASFYASIAAKSVKVPIRLYCQWGIRYVGFDGFSRKIFKKLEKVVCKKSTHIRAVSPLNMKFGIDEGLYPSTKVGVIGNGGTIGVDFSVYDITKKSTWNENVRNKLGLQSDDFVFGFSGRVSRDKGCTELFEAFKKVSSQHKKAKLMVVGPFEENCGIAQELIDWAKESDQVVFTGRIENALMKEYYSAMNVLVHPTYREGFGMVIQEAGALAVPAITTRIPGASEVMEDGVSCILVEPANIEDLCNSMFKMVEDKNTVESIGKFAYLRTKELYARPIMLENQKQFYDELLN